MTLCKYVTLQILIGILCWKLETLLLFSFLTYCIRIYKFEVLPIRACQGILTLKLQKVPVVDNIFYMHSAVFEHDKVQILKLPPNERR